MVYPKAKKLEKQTSAFVQFVAKIFQQLFINYMYTLSKKAHLKECKLKKKNFIQNCLLELSHMEQVNTF